MTDSDHVVAMETVPEPRTLDEWGEEDGDVVWWCWRNGQWLGETPYIGSPLDLGHAVEIELRSHQGEFIHRHDVGGWPGYHTHWTPCPTSPASPVLGEPKYDRISAALESEEQLMQEPVGWQHRGKRRGAAVFAEWRDGRNQSYDTAEGAEFEERRVYAHPAPISKGVTEPNGAPKLLWLSAADADNEHEVWFDPDEGGTPYLRADLAMPTAINVEEIIDAVMLSERYAPKIIPMGANPPLFDGMQPDNDGPWASRIEVAKKLRSALTASRQTGAK